jgi:hypothetical protein
MFSTCVKINLWVTNKKTCCLLLLKVNLTCLKFRFPHQRFSSFKKYLVTTADRFSFNGEGQ